jgi:hypothetical protein
VDSSGGPALTESPENVSNYPLSDAGFGSSWEGGSVGDKVDNSVMVGQAELLTQHS